MDFDPLVPKISPVKFSEGGQVNNSSWERLQQAFWRSNTCEEKRELGIIFSNKPIVLASRLTKLLPGMEIAGTSS